MQTLRGQTAVGALRLAGPGGTHSISKQFLGWLPPRGQDTHPNVSRKEQHVSAGWHRATTVAQPGDCLQATWHKLCPAAAPPPVHEMLPSL